MKYSALFKNTVGVTLVEGKYFPHRFSESMLAFYAQIDEDKRIRSRCSAGIKMAFYTESSEISFRYTIKSFARPIVAFDVYEDDQWVSAIREADGTQEGQVIYKKKQPGKVRLDIYLPYCCECYIYDIDIPQYEEVEDEAECFMCLGDSITQGMTAIYPSQTYTSLIARYKGYKLINQGVGGYIFDARSLDDVERLKPDHIVVAYGTNDYIHIQDISQIKRNVASYMEKLAKIHTAKRVTVLTPTWRADCVGGEQVARFGQITQYILDVASSYGFKTVQGLGLVGHMPSLYVDGLHPNDLGFNMFAMQLLKAMEEN